MKQILTRILLSVMLVAAAAPAALAVADAMPVPDERTAEFQQPQVKIYGQVIEFRSPDGSAINFEIYSITGQLIKTVMVKSAPVRVELPKGFYIIRCDSWTKRVMLK